MSKIYKHKIPDFEAGFFNDEENYYLWNVKSNFQRLFEIYEGKVSYVPSDYPTLINTFEQLYKGITLELQSLYPEKIKLTKDSYNSGHKFSHYAFVIDRIIPISENKDGFNTIKIQLEQIESAYNVTRYSDHKTVEEFRNDFRRLERGIYRLTEGLKLEYEKNRISDKEDSELELW